MFLFVFLKGLFFLFFVLFNINLILFFFLFCIFKCVFFNLSKVCSFFWCFFLSFFGNKARDFSKIRYHCLRFALWGHNWKRKEGFFVCFFMRESEWFFVQIFMHGFLTRFFVVPVSAFAFFLVFCIIEYRLYQHPLSWKDR